jgi:hypothetical protein
VISASFSSLEGACNALFVKSSSPTLVHASFAVPMNLKGSPESCLSPFHLLARSGFETKSSKKGRVVKVSVRAMERAPEG